MKDPDSTDEEKRQEVMHLMLHRRRSRMLYVLMNLIEDSVTVCFDVMENLVLPKSPIGQTYYSRQLYMYVFGVVNHHGRGGPQKKEDVTLYVWMEHQNRKDSDMILSAVWHFFNHGAMPGLLRDKKKLRLFSDSCYGQNKNINLLSMLFALRKQKQPGVHDGHVDT